MTRSTASQRGVVVDREGKLEYAEKFRLKATETRPIENRRGGWLAWRPLSQRDGWWTAKIILVWSLMLYRSICLLSLFLCISFKRNLVWLVNSAFLLTFGSFAYFDVERRWKVDNGGVPRRLQAWSVDSPSLSNRLTSRGYDFRGGLKVPSLAAKSDIPSTKSLSGV